MKPLLAVDWGTSSLRAALLGDGGQVLGERAAPRGILGVAPGAFPQVLREVCGGWPDEARLCLVSGMAGSRQGWLEAPYCPCPAGLGELAARLAWIEPGRIAIVPGLSCEQDGVPDVMRGEEVQVFGALDLMAAEDAWAVLPGTHSKWVRVQGGRIVSFSTFMTGEFYALLRRHSILARTLPAEDGELDEAAFVQGLTQAEAAASLLRAAFSARTLALFERMAPAALPSYLSGLLIGEEMRGRRFTAGEPVLVIGAPELTRRYALALAQRNAPQLTLGAEATWRGLWLLAQAAERA